MDPLAAHPLQIDKSPYAYGWNNPIRYIDPNGMCPNGCNENEKKGDFYAEGAVVQNRFGASQFRDGKWHVIERTPMTENSSDGIRINGFFGGGSSSSGEGGAGNMRSQNSGTSSGEAGNWLAATGFVSGATANQINNILDRNYHGYNQKSIVRTPKPFPNLRVSSSGLRTTTSVLKGSGVIAGVAGLYLTYDQFENGQISGTEATVDATFGVIGFFGLPGAAVSVSYFGGKLAYEYFSGNSMYNKPIQQRQ